MQLTSWQTVINSKEVLILYCRTFRDIGAAGWHYYSAILRNWRAGNALRQKLTATSAIPENLHHDSKLAGSKFTIITRHHIHHGYPCLWLSISTQFRGH